MIQMSTLTTIGSRSPEGGDRRLVVLWVVTAGAVVLHNFEEWLFDLTGWVAVRPGFPGRALHGDQDQFAVSLAIVTVAVFVLAAAAVAIRPRWSGEALVYVAYAIVFNGASHVLLSILTQSLMPGVITGVLILLPVGALTIFVQPAPRWSISGVTMTIIASVGIAAGALGLASVITG